MIASNTGHDYHTVNLSLRDYEPKRYIGKCKSCSKAYKLEGRIGHAMRNTYAPPGDAPGCRVDFVVVSADDSVTTCADLGTNPTKVVIKCGDHHVALHRVIEGKKKSKHACNAKCLASTGPNCDCRCKGANHGSSL